MPTLPQVSCYNTAHSYKSAATSDAQHLHSPAAAVSQLLHSMRRPPEFSHYTEYGGMEEGLNVGYSRAVTCAFFTNLAGWKLPYENRLIEISRESYDILACERYPNKKWTRQYTLDPLKTIPDDEHCYFNTNNTPVWKMDKQMDKQIDRHCIYHAICILR